MRRHYLTFAIAVAVFAVVPPLAQAAEVEADSRIEAVTVYPDGATVTRLIRLDLPGGDSTRCCRDFPLTLDPSSLRVEGEGGARLVIGAVDARRPRPAPPANLPVIDKQIEALRDRRDRARRHHRCCDRTSQVRRAVRRSLPGRSGEKGEARPLSEWRAAFAAISEEIAGADTAIRDAKLKQRDLDREIARLEADRSANPPRKLEVRIDLNASGAASALLRVTYSVRGARWAPIYDARLDTGSKDRKPSLELVRRAEIVQTSGEDWADVALAVSTVRTAQGRQRAGAGAVDRAVSAAAAPAVTQRLRDRAPWHRPLRPRRSGRRIRSASAPTSPSSARPTSSRQQPKPADSRSCSGFRGVSASRPARGPRASASLPRRSRPN